MCVALVFAILYFYILFKIINWAFVFVIIDDDVEMDFDIPVPEEIEETEEEEETFETRVYFGRICRIYRNEETDDFQIETTYVFVSIR